MNFIKVILLLLVAGLPELVLAGGAGNSLYVGDDLARQPGNFRYVGNNLAKQVCTAAANDDVRNLKRALLAYQRSLAHSYTFDRGGRDVAVDFTCNGMALQAFARQMGASNVASFMNGPGQVPEVQFAESGS